MINKTVLRMSLILLGIQLIGVVKQASTRYIIREWFKKGELTAFEFAFKIFNVTPQQVLGLGIIASFTLITFPLGIWMGSFKMGDSYSITNMVGSILNLVTFPVTLYTMSRVMGELEMNNKTWLGITLIVISKLIIILGCWFMYKGNQTQ